MWISINYIYLMRVVLTLNNFLFISSDLLLFPNNFFKSTKHSFSMSEYLLLSNSAILVKTIILFSCLYYIIKGMGNPIILIPFRFLNPWFTYKNSKNSFFTGNNVTRTHTPPFKAVSGLCLSRQNNSISSFRF